MAADYYITRRPGADGRHLIHREGCPFLQNRKEEILLGNFDSVNCAKEEALRNYSLMRRCRFCIREKSCAEMIHVFSRSLDINFLFQPGAQDVSQTLNILFHCTN